MGRVPAAVPRRRRRRAGLRPLHGQGQLERHAPAEHGRRRRARCRDAGRRGTAVGAPAVAGPDRHDQGGRPPGRRRCCRGCWSTAATPSRRVAGTCCGCGRWTSVGCSTTRTYTTSGRVVFEVDDPLGFAAGRFALEVSPDGATCSPTSESAAADDPGRRPSARRAWVTSGSTCSPRRVARRAPQRRRGRRVATCSRALWRRGATRGSDTGLDSGGDGSGAPSDRDREPRRGGDAPRQRGSRAACRARRGHPLDRAAHGGRAHGDVRARGRRGRAAGGHATSISSRSSGR